jgi:hypothetical protein
VLLCTNSVLEPPLRELLNYFKNFVGEDHYNRVAEILAGNLRLIVTALIVVIPLKGIQWLSSNSTVRGLADDSATILAVGLVLSLTAAGVEALFEAHYVNIKVLVQFAHEGLVVGVLIALFVRVWKRLRLHTTLRSLWTAIRSMRP